MGTAEGQRGVRSLRPALLAAHGADGEFQADADTAERLISLSRPRPPLSACPTRQGQPVSRYAPDQGAGAGVPRGTLAALPGKGRELALTVDDGTDSTVVAAYAALCERTGLRITFFCNRINPSWTDNARALRPLVDAGQVLMANHTWSHPDLNKLSRAQIAQKVTRNEGFLTATYGVTGRPFLRPPFGYHSAAVDGVLADLGYPAVTMWLGSLADSTLQTTDTILSMADQWFLTQHLVIGHANHPPVIQVMDQLVELVQERNPTPVYLGDVFDVAKVMTPAVSAPTSTSTSPPTATARPTH
jgi:peptidoglycan/xylan/chitin deacetylase (PgdA/CDA1 family)